jgi:hypothetical protein
MNRVSPAVTHSGSPRQWIDWLKLQLPIIGKTTRALATVKFCRALGALYSAESGRTKPLRWPPMRAATPLWLKRRAASLATWKTAPD